MLWKALLKHWQNKGQSLFVQILDAKPNWTSKKTYSNTLLLRSLIITFFLIIFFLFWSSRIFISSIWGSSKKGIKNNPLCTRGGSERIFFFDIAFLLRTGSKNLENTEKITAFDIFQSPDFQKITGISWLLSGNFRALPGFFPLQEIFLGIGCPEKKPPLLYTVFYSLFWYLYF